MSDDVNRETRHLEGHVHTTLRLALKHATLTAAHSPSPPSPASATVTDRRRVLLRESRVAHNYTESLLVLENSQSCSLVSLRARRGMHTTYNCLT